MKSDRSEFFWQVQTGLLSFHPDCKIHSVGIKPGQTRVKNVTHDKQVIIIILSLQLGQLVK